MKSKISRKGFVEAAGVGAAGLAGAALAKGKPAKAQGVPPSGMLPDPPNNPSGLLGPETRTYVGNEHNSELLDYYGSPLVIDTMITAVRFCNGTKSTDEPGGVFSELPADPYSIAVQFERNGVRYHEWILLLSGIGFHGISDFSMAQPYMPYVFGPVDASGHDFTDPEVAATNPQSPRIGLKWVPMRVALPYEVFNEDAQAWEGVSWEGRLMLNIEGIFNPGSNLFFYAMHQNMFVPDIDLLRNGWAFANYQHTGLVRNQQNPWAGYPWLNPDTGEEYDKALIYEDGYWRVPFDYSNFSYAYSRAKISFDAQSEEWVETRVVLTSLRDSLDNPGTNPMPDDGSKVSGFADATMARNVAGLLKNFLSHPDMLGQRPTTTIFGGASGTGAMATALNHGRATTSINLNPTRLEGLKHPQIDGNGRAARTGGNYNDPYNPSSGLVFDGFYCVNGMCGGGIDPNVQSTGDIGPVKPDHEFPVTAKIVHLNSVWDYPNSITGSMRWAHAIGKSFEGDGVHPSIVKDLNHHMRIFHINAVNHFLSYDFWPSGYGDGGRGQDPDGDWYYEGGENGIGLNRADGEQTPGRGRRLHYMIDLFDFAENPQFPDPAQRMFLEPGYNKPFIYPLTYKAIDNLARWAEEETYFTMPISRLDSEIRDPQKASTSTKLPLLPLAPQICQQGSTWRSANQVIYPPSCWASWGPVVGDCLVHVEGLGYIPDDKTPDRMSEGTVAAILYLGQDPRPLEFEEDEGAITLPEDAARVGYYVVDDMRTFLSPFTCDELRTTCEYANKADYLDQLGIAADQLIKDGLFDGEWGDTSLTRGFLTEKYLAEVANMPYPRTANPDDPCD